MKKGICLLLIAAMLLLGSSCSVPIIGDLIESENSLGKTNNTAVAIASAMEDYLKNKNKEDLALYGMELILNSDGNGTVKLYYTAAAPESAEYSDIYTAEVDSKTGHVERFSKADYTEDGIIPYQMVSDGMPFDAGTLPVDSEKAISVGARIFSTDQDFHYDYVQIQLTAPGAVEQYEIRYISMLNNKTYHCTVDAVSGGVLSSSVGELE